jgi:hypothetical protein
MPNPELPAAIIDPAMTTTDSAAAVAGEGAETPAAVDEAGASDNSPAPAKVEAPKVATAQVPAPILPQAAAPTDPVQAESTKPEQGRAKEVSSGDTAKTDKPDSKSAPIPALPAASLSIPEALAAAGVLASPPQQPQPPVLQTAGPAGTRSVSPLADAPGRQVQATALLATGPKLTKDDGAAQPDAPSPTPNANSFALLIGHDASKALANAQQPSATPRVDSSALTDASVQVAATDMDSQQLDALVRDIAAVSGKSARAEFRLAAEHLGSLDVRLHTSDAGVSVAIRTQSEQSHSTVAQAQHQLTDDMRANGLKVASTSVMLGQGGADRQRQDRAPAPAPAPIEVATGDREQSEPINQRRPTGRYA